MTYVNRKGVVCLNWIKSDETYISKEKFNQVLRQTYDNKNLKKIAQRDIAKVMYFVGTYQIISTTSYIEIRVFDKTPVKYKLSLTGMNNETKLAGYHGYQYINNEFQEKFGKSITTAFSGYKFREIYTAIKKCVITQVDYCEKVFKGKIIDHCFKSDMSSAYPWQLTKSLPTLHDHKLINGFVEPNEEYPFAFYLNSHHVKIYNELFTKDFGKSRYYTPYHDPETKWKPNDSIKPEDEITVLCKKSNYDMSDIFTEIYNMRKEKPELKLYMNACIGYFHRNNNPVLSPIAAVVLARCAHEMLERCKILEKEGNTVVLINTDSIIWKGKQSSISEYKKYFGSFTAEYEDTRVALLSVKAYQVEGPNGTVLTRHSGLDKSISRNLKFGEIFDFKNEAPTVLFFDEEGFVESI